MPNQIVSLTSPQRLAQALQSMGQNALLPNPGVNMAAASSPNMPSLGDMMALKRMMAGQPSSPMTPGDIQAANLRDSEDMSWGR